MDAALPSWVDEATALPVAFAQVREDARLDLSVAERLNDGFQAILVASGGCTGAALAASTGASHLHLVDLNPAQIALSRWKLHLLQTTGLEERLALLGHGPMPAANRAARITSELQALGFSPEALGPPTLLGLMGPDHCGRYEILFRKLREELSGHEDELEALLQLSDPLEQGQRVDSATVLGMALDEAFKNVMALPILGRLFGEAATQNQLEPFSSHFARRTRHVLQTLPASTNPYLWQMFLGRFSGTTLSPWLSALPPGRMPRITWSVGRMDEALAKSPRTFDFVHLSNILDWLSEEEARLLLDATWKALKEGGWVVIRQLNSNLEIPEIERRFEWAATLARGLHAEDRSFFYRELHLGRKP